MKNVLIISGHTDLENNSFANKIILNKLQELLPQAEYLFLDKEYPNYKIEVEKEQARLVKADVIVFQFPFFWYSMPSILHKYQEDVFLHGFSHGSKGKALVGKKVIISFTSGAPEEMYQEGGKQNYPIEAFYPPFKNFVVSCNMELAGIIYSGGLSYASRHDDAKLQAMKEKAIRHAEKLAEELKNLCAD